MSGALLSGLGAVGAITSVLFGGDGPVVLGSIVLTDQEVPASISWGGAQRLNVHKMPGGGRVIDAMGRDDAPISWAGRMIGADSDARAAAMDLMRVTGAPVPLSWGPHLYTVVVSQFDARDVAFMSEYSITCTVLRDESAAPADPTPSLIAAVGNDISAAVALASIGAAAATLGDVVNQGSAITSGVLAVQAITQSIPGGIAAGDPSATAIAAATVTAQAAVTAAVTDGDAQLAYINYLATNSGNLLGNAAPSAAVSNLTTVLQYSGLQASALAARGALGRIAANLAAPNGATDATAFLDPATPPAQAIGGNAASTVQTAGGNLFAIAAQQLGDATQWWRIAEASGLTDPMLSGVVTLTIPDAIPAPSDGIPDLYGATIL
jgi:hypothetical protein